MVTQAKKKTRGKGSRKVDTVRNEITTIDGMTLKRRQACHLILKRRR
jgi:hypothetical protein